MDRANLDRIRKIVVGADIYIRNDSENVMEDLVALWGSLSNESVEKIQTELDNFEGDEVFNSVAEMYLYMESKGCYAPGPVETGSMDVESADNLVMIDPQVYLSISGKDIVISRDVEGKEILKTAPVFEGDSVAMRRFLRDMNTSLKHEICVGRLMSVAGEYIGLVDILNFKERSAQLTGIYDEMFSVDGEFALGYDSPLLRMRTADARMWVSKVATLGIVQDTNPEDPFGSRQYILGEVILGIDYVGFKDNRGQRSSLLFFPYWENALGSHTTVTKSEYLATMWSNLAMFILYKHNIRVYPDNFRSHFTEESDYLVENWPRVDQQGHTGKLATGAQHFLTQIEEIAKVLCESRWSDR